MKKRKIKEGRNGRKTERETKNERKWTVVL